VNLAELSKKVGLPKDTIRFWEKRGLIHPRRSSNGYRTFEQEDIQRINLIKLAKEAGFTLDAISVFLDRILDDQASFTDLSEILVDQLRRSQEKIRELTQATDKINHILTECMGKGSIRKVVLGF
jgi:DNA-binding transcriptional MerR regulator